MAGVDITTAEELLGHRDIQTTWRYAHLAKDHKRNTIARLGKLVMNDTYNDANNDAKPAEKEKGIRLASVTP